MISIRDSRFFRFYIFLCLFPLTSAAQFNLGKLSYDDGLSHSTVLSLCRSSEGYLWIGTRDGLNRYDGVSIRQYRSDAADSTTLSTNNYIYAIRENPMDKTLWVGTQNGLNIYSPASDRFKRIVTEYPANSRSQHFAILSILFDGPMALIGTNNGIVTIKQSSDPSLADTYLRNHEIHAIFKNGKDYLLGSNKGLFVFRYPAEIIPIEIRTAKNPQIKSIKRVGKDKIWVASDNQGLIELDNNYAVQRHFRQRDGLSSDFVRTIEADGEGNVWVGTMNGIDILWKGHTKFQQLQFGPAAPFGLSDNSIKMIYRDNQQIMWIGTNFGGVNYYHPAVFNFTVDAADGLPHHLSGNLISALSNDSDGNIWVGTEREGLNVRKKGDENFVRIPLRSHTVKSIFADNQFVYVGTFDAGLAVINRKDVQDIIYLDTSSRNGWRLRQNYISSVAKDEDGNIWIGTGSNGVDIIRKGFSSIAHLDERTKLAISNNYIKYIHVGNHNQIWIATARGLNCLHMAGGEINAVDTLFRDDYINTVFEDSQHQVWVGTQEKGLIKYDPATGKREKIKLFPDFQAYHVLGITQGNTNEIFVVTNRGLVIYNDKNGHIAYKNMEDGIPTNQFLPNATLKLGDHILIGSYKGLIDLQMANRNIDSTTPQILVTRIQISGMTTDEARHLLGTANPNTISKLKLGYDQNAFTIHFASSNLIDPKKNRFAYRIAGLDTEWHITETPFVNYTNLPPGNYKLELKAINSNGITSDPAKILRITILPPFYLSVWAFIFYFVVAFAVVYFIYRYNLEKRQLKNKLFYEEKLYRNQQALLQSKVDFFTKISHEIRTPLTLIYAPIDKILRNGNLEKQIEGQLQIVRKNIQHLLNLMNEILTFSKLQSQKLRLQVHVLASQPYFDDIFGRFTSLAEEYDVDYILDNRFYGNFYADPQQLEKVILNLLSNAFKFRTKHVARIALRIWAEENNLIIHVMDNGRGIKEEDKEKIFDNFYQGTNDNAGSTGYGIGLSLAREIVELHKGEIMINEHVALQEGYKTVFTVILNNAVAEQELADDVHSEVQQESIAMKRADHEGLLQSRRKAYHLLIVEDNEELRAFLVNHLAEYYQITPAENGAVALQLLQESSPDIIITDIAMPGMDGFEMVRQLKLDQETAHIPVIMLTAKGEEADMIKGYQQGTMHYVVKPFNLQILELQIANLIAASEQIKERNRLYFLSGKVEAGCQSADEEYMMVLRRLIDEKMMDSQFSVGTLAEHMNQSQSALLKKVKRLTGLNVAELIKEIRLNRAAELLRIKESIAEVAYTVGFSDRKYFSREFKKKFGINPSEFREKQ
ncbi:response regulator [Sphingobacterium phlebotomi]|uniref:histidine kinase n=1 Tax=Sphingobacterium phlebotomi TaxID=2605433 RepID=A0A5D4H8F7_9SPHI|nr:two-component regulator propeller domain-containing protein [Sphingobacterium phlebotomi]TYR36968.1 response regulator [Sphingobacterium phlebotomi]